MAMLASRLAIVSAGRWLVKEGERERRGGGDTRLQQTSNDKARSRNWRASGFIANKASSNESTKLEHTYRAPATC